MTKTIHFHRKQPKELNKAVIVSDVVATLGLVVILGVLIIVAAMYQHI